MEIMASFVSTAYQYSTAWKADCNHPNVHRLAKEINDLRSLGHFKEGDQFSLDWFIIVMQVYAKFLWNLVFFMELNKMFLMELKIILNSSVQNKYVRVSITKNNERYMPFQIAKIHQSHHN